ncbi:hypothetical protein A2U01_0053928, partial [Trifolium medium]|nr:hypothetical protein [Trifolium medium]
MASSSLNRIDDDEDTVNRSLPREHDTVLSPQANDHEQTSVNNAGDPRDGEEASPFTEDEDNITI